MKTCRRCHYGKDDDCFDKDRVSCKDCLIKLRSYIKKSPNGHKKHTDEQFIEIVKLSTSIQQVLKKLGFRLAGGNYKTFHERVKRLNLDTSHFTGMAHLKGKTHHWGYLIPIEDILVKNSTYPTSKLKNRLIKANLVEDKCAICGLSLWLDKPISLEIHHINGICNDNRIDNLQLICPNCHSQTENFRGRNIDKNKSEDITSSDVICEPDYIE